MQQPPDVEQLRDEIIRKYPKSIQKVGTFIINRMQQEAAKQGIPKEAIETSVENVNDKFTAMVVLFSTDRVLEVLDDMKVFVSVYYDEASEDSFVYTHSQSPRSDSKPTRAEATRAAIEEVFELIEKGDIQ